MESNLFPQTIPTKDVPVLVFSKEHGFQVARCVGETAPSFLVRLIGKTQPVELTDVVKWWNLPNI